MIEPGGFGCGSRSRRNVAKRDVSSAKASINSKDVATVRVLDDRDRRADVLGDDLHVIPSVSAHEMNVCLAA